MLRLYGYYRSSAAYRVRIALALKGLAVDTVPVHLGRGEQRAPEWLARNPSGMVPALAAPEFDGRLLGQSLAIIEYLEETHPEPPLLPAAAAERARVRALALTVACDIHPLATPRVQSYLERTLGVDEASRQAWIRHWIEDGLAVVERLLAEDPRTGEFCHGDAPTLADCCLVPQVYNARRYACRLDELPNVRRIAAHCEALAAFRAAAPEAQPDAPPA